MLPSFMNSRRVELRRYPTIDDHNNLIKNYAGTPTPVVLYGSLQPVQDAMTTDRENRNAAQDGYLIYTGDKTQVEHDDRITINGAEYYVDGTPAEWDGTGTSLDHRVIRVSRWEE